MDSTDDYEPSVNDGVESPMSILKAMALGAHKVILLYYQELPPPHRCSQYPLTTKSWIEFEPKSIVSLQTTLYGETTDLTPPPLATPAILSFLALVNKRRSIPLPPSESLSPQAPDEWTSEWGRCFAKPKRDITECFRPGRLVISLQAARNQLKQPFNSIEGVWEGFFTVNRPPSVARRH